MKRAVIVSDLHIGTGHPKGQPNTFDDFREDRRFEQLLVRMSTGRHAEDEVHLVLNGDIFDLLKVSLDGDFPEAITERVAKAKLEQCLRGHPRFVKALSQFLAHPGHRITYQPGNHDMELFFPGVAAQFCRAVTGEDQHPRLRIIGEVPFFDLEGGVQVHHGHQFEAIHAMDFQRLFLNRPHAEPILNVPWGSLFILQVVNRLMRERPYLDKVMPFWPLFVGGLVFDTRFTLKMIATSAFYFGRARLNPIWWEKRPFEKLTKFLRTEIKVFEDLNGFAGKLLKNPKLNAIFMGHTHGEMVRTHPNDKYYVNTGTWVPMVNLGWAHLGQNSALHYGLVEYDAHGAPRVSLMRWRGRRAVTEEVTF